MLRDNCLNAHCVILLLSDCPTVRLSDCPTVMRDGWLVSRVSIAFKQAALVFQGLSAVGCYPPAGFIVVFSNESVKGV